MLAVTIMVMVMAMMALAGSPAAHSNTAGLAQLRVLGLHAGRDSRYVGNDIGTKPHRVGRTGLAGGVAALRRPLGRTLRGGGIKAAQKQGKQHDRAGQVNNAHVESPWVRRVFNWLREVRTR